MIVGIYVEQLWIFHWQSPLILLLGFRLGLLPCVVLGLLIVFLRHLLQCQGFVLKGNCDGPLDGMGSC